MIIEVGTGGRQKGSVFKAAVLSQLEQAKSCVSINISTCPLLLILPKNIRPWVDRSLAFIQNINVFVDDPVAMSYLDHPSLQCFI